ncbi:MAG: hypothetical protein CSA29_04315 [Desulfobacterales bacterium]|nr:MAG: hypothetical protein CSA29_04315 [Desulfobacterales bacterium]
MKKMINNIYETNKMKVEVDVDEGVVYKTFKKKNQASSYTMYHREKKALILLSDSTYFPNLLDFDDNKQTIKMSQLVGSHIETFSIHQIKILRDMVEKMLQAGVARHALPIRDFVAPPHDKYSLGMVDFERVTFRIFALSPFWLIAKKVTYYHLYRLIYQYHPHLLSKTEKDFYLIFENIRSVLQKLKPLRKKLKSIFK